MKRLAARLKKDSGRAISENKGKVILKKMARKDWQYD